MKRLVIQIFTLFLLISDLLGQQVDVTASFDSSRIFIGDQITFTVTVDQPSDIKLTLPIFKDTLYKNIEILSGPVTDSVSLNGRIKITDKYLITSFDTGFYQLPPVFAEIREDAGLKRFYSDYARLEVVRVNIAPADTTAKIYDIIKPYRAPVTLGEVMPWILLVAVICAMAWLIVIYIRRHRKSDDGEEVAVNPDPAHIIALRELERLKEEQLWQRGQIKDYYTRLTEILRQYLENRYRVFSLELTTSETLEALIKTGFRKDGSYNTLKSVLTGADLVKFAKYNPEPAENESHFQNSIDFVLATQEKPEVSEKVVENDNSAEERK